MTRLPDGRVPVILSAHAEDLLRADAAAILRYLQRHPDADVGSVAHTVSCTRRLRRHRVAARAADRGELVEVLTAIAEDREHDLVTRGVGTGASRTRPRVAFVFPGQGSQWPSMGVEAYGRLSLYRDEVDRCAAVFAAAGAASPLDYLLAGPDAATNDFSQVQIQGAQFVHGVALARVWRACGVLPDLTVGHSLGEIGAAYVAGTLTLDAAVGVVSARATVLDGLTGPYRVAVLGITAEEAESIVADTPGWLELSVVNSRSSVAVSGECEAVATAVRTVTDRGAFAKEIEMWFPAHTTALDSARAELESLLPAGQFDDAPVQFIGSATGRVVAAGTPFGDYWYGNLRNTVRFDRAVATAARRGAQIFVELSAHPALLFALGDLLDDAEEPTGAPILTVGTGRRDEPLTERMAANIAAVALADPGYRLDDLLDPSRTTLRDFPFAPMRAERHWAETDLLPPVTGLTVAGQRWDELPIPAPAGRRRVAVVGTDPALTDALRGAAEIHDDTVVSSADDADLLVVVAPASAQADPVAAVGELSRLVDEGVLRYPITSRTRDIWLVTARAERIDDTDDEQLPTAVALVAMHRSIGFEHPDHTFRHLDVPAELDAAGALAAMSTLVGDVDHVALRAGAAGPVLLRRSMADDEPAPQPSSTDPGLLDNVVITGGAGSVGLHHARALIESGARRIVLLSRGGLEPSRLAELRGRHDVEIVAPRCDLTDRTRIAETIAKLDSGAATLVVHAAGVATIAAGLELTGADVEDTCAAKVNGIVNLLDQWPLRADTRIVMCSSVSGLWGGSGHAAYAAANRLLDVVAIRQRAMGRRCTSIRWGLWPGAGIIDDDEIARVQRSGLRAMPPDRAVEAALRDYSDDPLVYLADPERLETFLGAHLRNEPVPQADSRETTAGLVPASDPAAGNVGALRLALGAVLKLSDTSGLDLDTSLLDLGVDSLLALDLRKKLKKATGHSVPLAVILGGISATGLIERLERLEKEAVSRD